MVGLFRSPVPYRGLCVPGDSDALGGLCSDHGAVFQSTASSPDRTDPWADREDLPVGDRHCDRIGCYRFQRSGVPDAPQAAETGAPGQL